MSDDKFKGALPSAILFFIFFLTFLIFSLLALPLISIVFYNIVTTSFVLFNAALGFASLITFIWGIKKYGHLTGKSS